MYIIAQKPTNNIGFKTISNRLIYVEDRNQLAIFLSLFAASPSESSEEFYQSIVYFFEKPHLRKVDSPKLGKFKYINYIILTDEYGDIVEFDLNLLKDSLMSRYRKGCTISCSTATLIDITDFDEKMVLCRKLTGYLNEWFSEKSVKNSFKSISNCDPNLLRELVSTNQQRPLKKVNPKCVGHEEEILEHLHEIPVRLCRKKEISQKINFRKDSRSWKDNSKAYKSWKKRCRTKSKVTRDKGLDSSWFELSELEWEGVTPPVDMPFIESGQTPIDVWMILFNSEAETQES